MHLLYLWRIGQDDISFDKRRVEGLTSDELWLDQNNPVMHDIGIGESLWAFARSTDGRYILTDELVVSKKTLHRADPNWGRYRVWGDPERSRCFKLEGQPDVEPLIRSLSVPTNAPVLGRSFQGHNAVRAITLADHNKLRDWSSRVLILSGPSTDVQPNEEILEEQEAQSGSLLEQQLEEAMIAGSEEELEDLIPRISGGITSERREYLIHQAPIRNRQLVQELQELYKGRCQLCLWDPQEEYGKNLCHAHHIDWLSRGGRDEIENMILICPNHHAAIHHANAQFDLQDLAFVFGNTNRRDYVQLNLHLDKQ